MKITLRPAEITDAKDLNRVKTMDGVFQSTCNHPGESIWETEEWINEAQKKSYLFIADVATGKESRVVGYVMLTINPNIRMRHCATLRIAVDTEYQGQGIGKKLFAYIVNFSDNVLCLDRLELVVIKGMDTAISIYTRNGFEIEGTSRKAMTMNGEYVDILHMARLRKEQL